MVHSDFNQLAREIIKKDKWWDILSRFIDVLRINLFLVDSKGFIILPPEESKYGGRLLTDSFLGFDFLHDQGRFLEKFNPRGSYLESRNDFDLYTFAIPVKVSGEKTIAYMVLGPIILNKRNSMQEYQELASSLGGQESLVIDEISSIRVVSNVMMNSILDLLSEIIRDNVERSVRQRERGILDKVAQSSEQKINKVMDDVYNSVSFDEILCTLLDVALNMTQAEAGSIMVLDEDQKTLSIKVSRGLNKERISSSLKVGEGIAGLAVKEDKSFLLNGKNISDNRISHLLKRPEIKEALVMPLKSEDRVIGVLNLHTKNDFSQIEKNLPNLKHLSKFLSSAF